MSELVIQASPLQTRAVREAAQGRGLSVSDYVLDCALTYAATHLQRPLSGWLEQERTMVGNGSQQCRTELVLETDDAGKTVRSLVCDRLGNHERDAVAALDTHAAWVNEAHGWQTWQAGQ